MEQTISCLFTVERRIVMEIREVGDGNAKKEICDTVLHRLPEWFGIEESIAEYVSLVEEMPFYGVYDGERPVGFLAVKIHNAFTAEVCVMGILKEYHRMGIGSELMERAEGYCQQKGLVYLTVKTLDGSVDFEPYERTRRFYEKWDLSLWRFSLCSGMRQIPVFFWQSIWPAVRKREDKAFGIPEGKRKKEVS